MPGKRRRVSYTSEFKLKVVAKAEESGNRAAGKFFEVDESNVRLWRKSKDVLAKMGNRSRSNRHGLPSWPVLEENLFRWVTAQRDLGVPISTVKIRIKARIMAQEMGLDNFQGGPTWCYRFMRRKNLRVRTKTTVGQSLPADWEEKSENFLRFTKDIISKEKFDLKEIVNMDEVPLSFDCPPNRTVDVCGANTVPIKTTGHEKTCFTVVLACAANGDKLDPMVIFKRKTMPKENFPKGVVIQVNEKGWMNEEVMQTWIKEVWRKRKGAFFKPNGLLVMDSMRAHIQDSALAASKAAGAKVSIIPGGLTKKLQPLDVGVNKSFKSKVRTLWEDWMSSGLHTFTRTGKMRRATLEEVSTWVKKAWDEVSQMTVQNAFRKSGIVPEAVGLAALGEESDSEDRPNQLPEDYFQLFDSDSDDSEFEGFT